MSPFSLKDFPEHIQLQTHTKCNLACGMCPHPVLGLNEDRTRMSWAAFERVMDECLRHESFRSIVLDLQNEPLLDHDLDERVRWIKQRSDGRINVGVTTNGVLLTAERAARLFATGIDTVVVSANAVSAATYNELVPGDYFARLDDNLRACLALPDAPKKLLLSFGYSGENRHELEPFLLRAGREGLRYRVFPMHDRLGLVKSKRFLAVPSAPTCHLPFKSMAVLVNGDAVLCCQDWTRARVMGNVFERSIREVWCSTEYLRFREAILDGVMPAEAPCAKCKHPVATTDRVATAWELLKARPRYFEKVAGDGASDPMPQPAAHYVLVPRGDGYQILDSIRRRTMTLSPAIARVFEALRDGTTRAELSALAAREGVEAPAEAWVDRVVGELRRCGIFDEPSASDVSLRVARVVHDGRSVRCVSVNGPCREITIVAPPEPQAEVTLRFEFPSGVAVAALAAMISRVDDHAVYRIELEGWEALQRADAIEWAGHPTWSWPTSSGEKAA